jgi:LPXTG-motif cell wall-anchored protein
MRKNRRREKMMLNRSKKLFAVLLLLIGLLVAVNPVSAENLVSKETITINGNAKLGIENLLPVTEFQLAGKKTALDILIETAGESNVEITESAYGKMITSIKGLKAKDTYFWGFYINGISSQIGADSYFVQPGDQINFQYVDWTVAPEKTVSLNVTGPKGVLKEADGIEFKGEPTAFQLLQLIFGEKLVSTESQYGKMITGIDGVAAEGTYYWAFYVNGKMAETGADSYKLQAGDRISFQLESWESPKEEEQEENGSVAVEPISALKLQESIELASKYVLKNQVGDWEAIALHKAGKQLPSSYLQEVKEQIIKKEGKFNKITDYERYTLGILAAGGNPTNVAGFNLVASIYNGDVTKQGLNGVFYGLIALDSANFEVPNTAKWTREKLVAHLIEKQNPDGGWSWDGSKTSDIDTTAMVLTSLAPYKNQANVKTSVDKAVQYLSSQFKSGKIDNSSTASQVVIGLAALDIDSNSEMFTKGNVSLIAYLISFQNKDGGFDWQGGEVSDVFSTGQTFQAIVAYQLQQNGKGSLYEFLLQVNDSNQTLPEKGTESASGEKNSDESQQDGLPLPNTSTNSYNYLLFGVLLFVLGVAFLIVDKRKKA